MTKQRKTILSIVLFVVIFGVLLTTATFTDLQVSNILTKGVLSSDSYIAHDAFASAFEAVGSVPIYLAMSFAVSIFGIAFIRCAKNIHFFDETYPKLSKITKIGGFSVIAYLLAAVCFVGATVATYEIFNDSLGYTIQHLVGQPEPNSDAISGMKLIVGFIMAAVFAAFTMLAVNNFSDDSIRKLVNFGIATLAMVVVALLLIELIKKPVGRIRYRAMNMYADDPHHGFAAYQRWFDAKGQWIEKDEMRALFGTTDALKSFPSGHTRAAGCSYAAIMLIDTLGIKNKKAKAAIWILPVIFTGIVAVTRIMVGAHFFSDVLVGGTIAFVCMIISREIFICKGANVKAIFGK